MAQSKPKPGTVGSKNASTRAASKGGFKLPAATRKTYKPPREKKTEPMPLCGAKKRTGRCGMKAGWGTSHPGIGRCKYHGGSVPNHVKAAATEEHRRLLGKPMDINPLDALLMCIRIRAGEIEWLSQEMARLDKKDWIEDTIAGKQLHWCARERKEAMRDLARYSHMAISLGIAERAVKLAETYGEMIANYTQGILEDLAPYMNEEGRRQSLHIVRKHLILLDAGRPNAELPPGTVDGEVVDEEEAA